MAIYTATEATGKAVDLAKAALEAGWFTPVIGANYGDPAKAGRENAQFLGAFIKQLTEEIKAL
ncbi:hypothetical protein ACFSHT_10350 [Paraburkholderia silviterrae]|uniref:Uncharacterized protein n=1 Tax=Paraburkholderia silviterrae TaxID=2528715 RepID=A0A4V2ZZI0_9BURK|nr:hypothetical protein [Paraburkholderia silviterrae]TDG25351.1 hypothetical protein EYW47_05830 [Paraburkholderia silviterrae]